MARSSVALLAAQAAVVLIGAGVFGAVVFGATPRQSSDQLQYQLRREKLQALLTQFEGTETLDEILFIHDSEIHYSMEKTPDGYDKSVVPAEDIVKVLSYECAGTLFGDTEVCQEYQKIPVIVEAKAFAREKSGWHKKAFYASLATIFAGIGTIIAYAYSDGYFEKQQNKSAVS